MKMKATRKKEKVEVELPEDVVTIDIETSPLITYAWSVWEANAIKKLKETTILCVSYKFLGEKKVYNISQMDDPNWKPGVENDKWVMERLAEVLNRASTVVTQNGNSFDLPIIRRRMLINGVRPPHPLKKVDTKILGKNLFRFDQASLKAMCEETGTAQKGDPGGFATWEGCMSPNRKLAVSSFKRMIKYNNQDVIATEELYLRMRPFMETHPNLAVIAGRPDCCKLCLNKRLQARGWEYTDASRRRRFQCVGPSGCGTWVNKGAWERLNKSTD